MCRRGGCASGRMVARGCGVGSGVDCEMVKMEVYLG